MRRTLTKMNRVRRPNSDFSVFSGKRNSTRRPSKPEVIVAQFAKVLSAHPSWSFKSGPQAFLTPIGPNVVASKLKGVVFPETVRVCDSNGKLVGSQKVLKQVATAMKNKHGAIVN